MATHPSASPAVPGSSLTVCAATSVAADAPASNGAAAPFTSTLSRRAGLIVSVTEAGNSTLLSATGSKPSFTAREFTSHRLQIAELRPALFIRPRGPNHHSAGLQLHTNTRDGPVRPVHHQNIEAVRGPLPKQQQAHQRVNRHQYMCAFGRDRRHPSFMSFNQTPAPRRTICHNVSNRSRINMQNGMRYGIAAGSVLALIATSIPGVGADALPAQTRQGQLRIGGTLDAGESRQNDFRCRGHAALDGFGRPLLVQLRKLRRAQVLHCGPGEEDQIPGVRSGANWRRR